MKIINIDELLKDKTVGQKLESGMIIHVPRYDCKYLVATKDNRKGEFVFINLEMFYIPACDLELNDYTILGKME